MGYGVWVSGLQFHQGGPHWGGDSWATSSRWLLNKTRRKREKLQSSLGRDWWLSLQSCRALPELVLSGLWALSSGFSLLSFSSQGTSIPHAPPHWAWLWCLPGILTKEFLHPQGPLPCFFLTHHLPGWIASFLTSQAWESLSAQQPGTGLFAPVSPAPSICFSCRCLSKANNVNLFSLVLTDTWYQAACPNSWFIQFSHSVVSDFLQPMDRSMPGLPVLHHLPEFAQTHVHWVSDAIQPSHPLSSPSPPAFNLSQHQGLFQWVSSSHHVAKVLEFQHQSFQWILTDFL